MQLSPIAALVVLAGILTGCANGAASLTPTPTSTPTPTIPANSAACDDFATATSHMGSALNSEDANNDWADVRAEFDEAALAADGAVAERLADLVDDWPEASRVFVFVDARREMNASLDDIGRACKADGFEVAYETFIEP